MTRRSRTSAGLLLFRRDADGGLEVLLGHMGGPFWAKKDAGAWSVPKGEYDPATEDALVAARREFTEELGLPVPGTDTIDLGSCRQSGGKVVQVWAVEGQLDPADVVPGTFDLEWPPRSGRLQSFPEVDRVQWFDVDDARERIVTAQTVFLDRLREVTG